MELAIGLVAGAVFGWLVGRGSQRFRKRQPYNVHAHQRLGIGGAWGDAQAVVGILLSLAEGETLTLDIRDEKRDETVRDTWTRKGDAFEVESVSPLESEERRVAADAAAIAEDLNTTGRWARWR